MAPVISSVKPSRIVPRRASLACFTFSIADKFGSLICYDSINVFQISSGRLQFFKKGLCIFLISGFFNQLQDGIFYVLTHLFCPAYIEGGAFVNPLKKFICISPDFIL